jgi:hypothetical protein
MARGNLSRFLAVILITVLAVVFYWYGNPPSASIWFAVLGSVVAACCFELLLLAFDAIEDLVQRRTLRATFGHDLFGDGISLVYAEFKMTPPALAALQSAGIALPHMAIDDQSEPTFVFRVDQPVASHDLRGLTHLAGCLTERGARSRIERAADVVRELNRSFIAFGLAGSQKARQVLDQLVTDGISYVDRKGQIHLVWTANDEPLAAPSDDEIGYIIRVRPRQFPARTWILCAGTGPDGTAAAAMFLSQHFRSINGLTATDGQRLGTRPCIIVTRSAHHLDETAAAEMAVPLLGRRPSPSVAS